MYMDTESSIPVLTCLWHTCMNAVQSFLVSLCVCVCGHVCVCVCVMVQFVGKKTPLFFFIWASLQIFQFFILLCSKQSSSTLWICSLPITVQGHAQYQYHAYIIINNVYLCSHSKHQPRLWNGYQWLLTRLYTPTTDTCTHMYKP